MEEVVAGLLTRHNSTISAAESCTGGLLAQRLTSIAGSSSYFLGGVVSYSNELKTAWADVPPELIQTKGAVSSEVAIALAEGIRRHVGSTLGVGITGIAGPGGGTEEKPVGTVHIALSHAGGVKSAECSSRVIAKPSLACLAAGARSGARPFPLQRRGAAGTQCQKVLSSHALVRRAGDSVHGARKSRGLAQIPSHGVAANSLGASGESSRDAQIHW